MEFTVDERAYLNEMRMLSTDSAGNEIFVGLTVEESKEYYKYTRLRFSHNGNEETLDRSVELNEKHELARRAVLEAESIARRSKATRH